MSNKSTAAKEWDLADEDGPSGRSDRGTLLVAHCSWRTALFGKGTLGVRRAFLVGLYSACRSVTRPLGMYL